MARIHRGEGWPETERRSHRGAIVQDPKGQWRIFTFVLRAQGSDGSILSRSQTWVRKSRSAHWELLNSALSTPESFPLNLFKTSSQSQHIRRPLAPLFPLPLFLGGRVSDSCRCACFSPRKPAVCLKMPFLRPRRVPRPREGLWGFAHQVWVVSLPALSLPSFI